MFITQFCLNNILSLRFFLSSCLSVLFQSICGLLKLLCLKEKSTHHYVSVWWKGKANSFPCFSVTLQLPFSPLPTLPCHLFLLLSFPPLSYSLRFSLSAFFLHIPNCLPLHISSMQPLVLCLCRQVGGVVFNTINLNSTSNWYNDGYENRELEILSLQQLEKDTIFVATESILFFNCTNATVIKFFLFLNSAGKGERVCERITV